MEYALWLFCIPTLENYIVEVLGLMCRRDYENVTAFWNEHRKEAYSGLEQLKIFFEATQKTYFEQGVCVLAVVETQLYLYNTESKDKVCRQMVDNYLLFRNVIEQCIADGRMDGSIWITDTGTDVVADTVAASMWGMLNQLAFVDRLELRPADFNRRVMQTFFSQTLMDLAKTHPAIYWSKGFICPDSGDHGLVGEIVDITAERTSKDSLAELLKASFRENDIR